MEQDHEVKALELEGVLDGAEAAAEWVVVDSERVENVYAPIVAIKPPIREVPPATRSSARNVEHQ